MTARQLTGHFRDPRRPGPRVLAGLRPPGRRLDRRRQLLARLPDHPDRALLRLGAARRDWPPRRFSPSWFGLVVIAGGILVLLAGLWGSELFLSRIALLPGDRRHRAVSVRLGSICDSAVPDRVPVPDDSDPRDHLQPDRVSAAAARVAARRVGHQRWSAFRCCAKATCSILANTSLEVAEACSGIRSLVSLITLGIVYGYFMDSAAVGADADRAVGDSGRDRRQRRARGRHRHGGAVDRAGSRPGLLPRVLRLDCLHLRVRDDPGHSASHRQVRAQASRTGRDARRVPEPEAHAYARHHRRRLCCSAASIAVARADRARRNAAARCRSRCSRCSSATGRACSGRRSPTRVLEVLGLDDYLTRALRSPEARGRRPLRRLLEEPAAGRHDALAAELPAGRRLGAGVAVAADLPRSAQSRGAPLSRSIASHPERPGAAARARTGTRAAAASSAANTGASSTWCSTRRGYNRTDAAIVRVIVPVDGTIEGAEDAAETERARVRERVDAGAQQVSAGLTRQRLAAHRPNRPMEIAVNAKKLIVTAARRARCSAAAVRSPTPMRCSPRATSYFEKKLVPEAIVQYQLAAQADPKRGDVRAKLAEAYLQQSDLPQWRCKQTVDRRRPAAERRQSAAQGRQPAAAGAAHSRTPRPGRQGARASIRRTSDALILQGNAHGRPEGPGRRPRRSIRKRWR